MFAMQGWAINTNGTGLWNMLQQSFGWVTTSGYTSKGNLTTMFPVVIGEFGSNYVDDSVSRPPPLAVSATHGCLSQKDSPRCPITSAHAHPHAISPKIMLL